ncbi:MAG: ThiF family adenylyltransferase [Bacillaceae bacterium]|nr:ThiF family adenylyltransferase [Bacillaceae bacterium]
MEKWIPMINEDLDIYVDENNGSIIFSSVKTGMNQQFELDDVFLKLIRSINGEMPNSHLYEVIKKDFQELTKEEFIEGIGVLLEEGIIRFKNKDSQTVQLQNERYKRLFEFFNDYSEYENPLTSLQKLSNAKVVLIGIGGGGTWVSHSLVMSGIKTLIIIDDDEIELSNLNRQPLFREKDIGKKKACIAAEYLKDLNPSTEIVPVLKKVTSIEDLAFLDDDIDLIISCADFPSTKEMGLLVTRYSYPRNIPHIIGGGYNSHLGKFGTTIIPNKSACFNCCITTKENEMIEEEKGWQLIKSHSYVNAGGSLSSLAGLVGSFLALEATKVITNFARPHLMNKTLSYHLSQNSFLENSYKQINSCEICGEN